MGFVRTLNGDTLPLIPWEVQEFAQLLVALGSLWYLMFEGCVLNLENYLHHGNAPHCSARSGIKMYQL